MENRQQDRDRSTRVEVHTESRPYVTPGVAQAGARQGLAGAGTGGVKHEAEEVGERLREQASEVADLVQDSTRSMFDQRKGQVTHELHGLASAFRRTGDQLRQEDKGSVANYSERIAGQLDRLSDNLENKSADELIDDVEDFARERPEVFLGGAFILGLLAARVLRSPSRRETAGRRRYQPYYTPVAEREPRTGTWAPAGMRSGEEVR